MGNEARFYIDGRWVEPVHAGDEIAVVDPATEEEVAQVAAASAADVDAAVQAAHRAFATLQPTPRGAPRAAHGAARGLQAADPAARRGDDDRGRYPAELSRRRPGLAGARHLEDGDRRAREYRFEEDWGTTRIVREPVGVCGLLAPWNWPMNQVRPRWRRRWRPAAPWCSSRASSSPLSALVFAEAVDEAGVPAGVFNMVNGAGPPLARLAAHPLVDMVSVTGSTEVAAPWRAAAAPSIKRVSQELGGKSANIVFGDVGVERGGPAACKSACTTPARRATRRRGCWSRRRSTRRR